MTKDLHKLIMIVEVDMRFTVSANSIGSLCIMHYSDD